MKSMFYSEMSNDDRIMIHADLERLLLLKEYQNIFPFNFLSFVLDFLRYKFFYVNNDNNDNENNFSQFFREC